MNKILFKFKYLNLKTVSTLLILVIAFFTFLILHTVNKNNYQYSFNCTTNIGKEYDNFHYYLKNHSLFFIDKNNVNIKLLDNISNKNINKDNLSINTIQIENSDSFFFFIPDFSKVEQTLYKYEKGKGTTKIDENIFLNSLFIQHAGKIVYAKSSSINNTLGILYLYKNGCKTKISNDCYKMNTCMFSDDDSAIAYIETDTKTSEDYLYVTKTSGEKTLVTKNKNLNILAIYSNGSKIIYDQRNGENEVPALNSVTVGCPPELISENARNILLVPKDLSMYFIGDFSDADDQGNLYYKENDKPAVKIDTNVENFEYYYDVSSKSPSTSYFDSINKKDLLYVKKDPSGKNVIRYLHNNSKPTDIFSEVTGGATTKVSANNSFIHLSYDKSSKLLFTRFSLNNNDKSQTTIDGNLCYPKENIYLEYYGKLFFTTRTANKVTLNYYSIPDNKTFYLTSAASAITDFYVNNDTLCYISNDELWVKNSSKSDIKLCKASEIISVNNTVYFYQQQKNKTYTLYKYLQGKSPKLMESGIEAFQ